MSSSQTFPVVDSIQAVNNHSKERVQVVADPASASSSALLLLTESRTDKELKESESSSTDADNGTGTKNAVQDAVSDLTKEMLRAQKDAQDRIATGDYIVKDKIIVGVADVRDVYLIGQSNDYRTFDNCLSVLKTMNSSGFITSNIVHVHPLDGNRSLYCTHSGSIYECPSDLEYSGIPREFHPQQVAPGSDLYFAEREHKLAVLRATRDRTLAKYHAGNAYIVDYWHKYPNATSTEYVRSDFHDSAYRIGNMMTLPCIVFNDGDRFFRFNSTPPILHALKAPDGKFVYILKNEAVMILDKEPGGAPVMFDAPIKELVDGLSQGIAMIEP